MSDSRCHFECAAKGKCIFEDNQCELFLNCRFIRNIRDACCICLHKDVCVVRKERRKKCKVW